MTWYVNPDTGLPDNDGRGVETAFRNLSRAIEAATAGDTVLLVPAAYDEDLPKLVARARNREIAVGVLGGH